MNTFLNLHRVKHLSVWPVETLPNGDRLQRIEVRDENMSYFSISLHLAPGTEPIPHFVNSPVLRSRIPAQTDIEQG
jgi:hypothetical protein